MGERTSELGRLQASYSIIPPDAGQILPSPLYVKLLSTVFGRVDAQKITWALHLLRKETQYLNCGCSIGNSSCYRTQIFLPINFYHWISSLKPSRLIPSPFHHNSKQVF